MGNTLSTLDRAFEMLEFIVENGSVTVAEAATEFDVPRSTVYEYFQTLKSSGYIIKENGRYRLSMRFLELGTRTRKNLNVYRTSRRELRDLADSTGEQTYLMIEENGYGMTVFTARGRNRLKVHGFDGLRSHLNTTAGGKAILAGFSDEEVGDIIEMHGLREVNENTIATEESLYQELDKIREEGIAINSEERVHGMSALAATLTNRKNDVIGAIAIYGPTSSIEDDNPSEAVKPNLKEQLIQTTNIIEVNLSHADATRG